MVEKGAKSLKDEQHSWKVDACMLFTSLDSSAILNYISQFVVVSLTSPRLASSMYATPSIFFLSMLLTPHFSPLLSSLAKLWAKNIAETL